MSVANSSGKPFSKRRRQKTARTTELVSAFKSGKTDIVSLWSMFLCSRTSCKVKMRSIQPRTGRKPAWCSRLHLSRVLDNQPRIMSSSITDALITKIIHARIYHVSRESGQSPIHATSSESLSLPRLIPRVLSTPVLTLHYNPLRRMATVHLV